MTSPAKPHEIPGLGDLPSPSLVIFVDLVRRNIEKMIEMAGGTASRLRPHVKTHKMPDVVRLLESMGIHKHKCATIAEAEMIAGAGGRDVLVAYPLVGPNVERFSRLLHNFPETEFRATVDTPESAQELSRVSTRDTTRKVPVLVDLDVGMGRTGIAVDQAGELCHAVAELPALELDGLHAYDGHIRDKDLAERAQAAAIGRERVLALRDSLRSEGLPLERLVLGGTPTFPCHRKLGGTGVEFSPGTSTLHDQSYSAMFPDLPFSPAAFLLTRVISRPRPGRICLDLGYKAVSPDPAGARAFFPDLPDAAMVGHSEEHLVLETARASELAPGTALLAVPTHVCPTCALYREAFAVEGNQMVGTWPITARDRRLTI
jgi:D-serine deaminase-like pyridoxal phosphate-dependent protein